MARQYAIFPADKRPMCVCCHNIPASAIFLAQFKTQDALKALCAACAFYMAWRKWSGFFSPKLVHLEIVATITIPRGG